MPTRDSSFSSPIFLDALKSLSHIFDLKCDCAQCGWSDSLKLDEVDFYSLRDLKQQMSCPACSSSGLNISVVDKEAS